MPKKYYLGSRKHLVNLGYTHTSIDKQLIKEERIKTEPLSRPFDTLTQMEPRVENTE